MLHKNRIDDAISRLPSQASSQIRTVRENAERLGAHELVAACDRELSLRGNLSLSVADAKEAQEQAASVRGKPLPDVIAAAFTAIPADEFERSLLRAIDENPGAPFAVLEEAFGRKDTSLVGGHLVYNRFGFFRQFLELERDQSSILIIKGKRSGSVTWELKAEARAVFVELGLL